MDKNETLQSPAAPKQTMRNKTLADRARIGAGSDYISVHLPKSHQEELQAVQVRKELSCSELSELSTSRVLCQEEEPTDAEIASAELSSLRFGKRAEQCNVIISNAALDNLLVKYVTTKDSKELLASFVAYHEGAHCRPENAPFDARQNVQGQTLVLQDYIDLPDSELVPVLAFREAHSDALALLALGREQAKIDQFPKYKNFLAEAALGYGRSSAIGVNNPLTRSSLFRAFALSCENFDESLFANLTDKQLLVLAEKIATLNLETLPRNSDDEFHSAVSALLVTTAPMEGF